MPIKGNGVTTMSPYGQDLASISILPRSHLAGDGTEPNGGGGKSPQSQQDSSSDLTADERALNDGILPPSGPTLADAAPGIKFKTIEQLVRSQDRLAKNRWAIDTHHRRVRAGVPFARLEKVPNQSIWVAKLPNGMSKESSSAVPNKADDLCNKVEDTLMADPAKPDPSPHVEDESAQEASKLASEFLSQDGGETGTNDIETYRWALNNAFTGSASFLHYVIDKSGGGYQPLQKLAHPMAQDPQNPMVAMIPLPSSVPGQAPAMIQDRSADPILRYVSAPDDQHPSGQFVNDVSQADRVWLPKIRIERMRREQVRCFPPTKAIEESDAVVFIRSHTLAEARREWAKTVGQMQAEELSALAGWRPPLADQMIAYSFKSTLDVSTGGPGLDEVGSLSPLLQRRMFSYRLYVKTCPEYPSGYWCDVNGSDSGQVLDEGDLEYSVSLPSEGKAKRCRDIPGVMVRPCQDVDGLDPTGWPFIARFAGSSEASATLLSAFMDVCDNMLHPHVFLRSTSAVDEDDWFDRLTPIILSPTDPEPTYERFPTLPPILPLWQELSTAQDTSSGLTATAQGLDSSNSVSGVAKNLTVRQALISLSGFQQNLHSAMSRGWNLKCQLVQAEFTTPQLLQFSGEEGSAQTRWWTGEDFIGVDRVGIQPGTGTMMTPEGKAQYVAFLQSQQWLEADQAAEVALPGIRMDLGLPQNPFEASIERSVGAWLEGPPDGWVEQKQNQDQQLQAAHQAYAEQTSQAAAMGQPVQPFVPPQLPPLPNPFPPRPNDNEPRVATVYMKRLSKLFVDPKYSAQPPEWQSLPITAYQTAVQALQPPPQLPKGVVISDKVAGGDIGQEEQKAISGLSPSPSPTGGVQHPEQPKATPIRHVPASPTAPRPQRPI